MTIKAPVPLTDHHVIDGFDDRGSQGKGIGRALFRDAGLRVLHAADIIGVRGLLVDAITEEAKAFYLALGMSPSPLDPMTLMVTLTDLKAATQSEQ